jgi:proteasome-associated ATPase
MTTTIVETEVTSAAADGGRLVSPALQTLEDWETWIETLVDDGADLQPLVNLLVQEKFQTQEVLTTVREQQRILREEIESLLAPEQYPVIITAVYPGTFPTVEVASCNARLRVAVHPKVNKERLCVGARGLLSSKKNCLIYASEERPEWSDVATFEEFLPGCEDRLLVKHQEQLIALRAAPGLHAQGLKKGDLLGIDRDAVRMAYAKIEQPGRQDLFFEKTPTDRFDELGGLDDEIGRLRWAVEFHLKHANIASRYRLQAKRGILLEGPPGNGKTKLARCLANFVSTLVPAGECHFMAIAGSSDYSMWLGQSEQKLIARFEAARELSTRSSVPVVMFFDEIDAIGRRRGSDAGSSAPDRILATLLAQLDGVTRCPNLIVIGATNRADILDPGLVRPGRLGDLKIRIGAPNRQAAGAIFTRYLGDLPTAEPVEVLIKGLLAKVYADAGVYAEMARVAFRDGSRFVVKGRDLISGAILENVARQAAEAAAEREARGGAQGLSEEDLAFALDREMRGIANLLTPASVRGYVARLPGDKEPVGVEVLLK